MRCEKCFQWTVDCPCCDTSFCPGCGRTEEELEEESEEE